MGISVAECTSQQLSALEKVAAWYHDLRGSQVYRQFGFAGTGKTSLARLMVDQLGLEGTRFAAYTGKAAQVLRSKGCPDVSTIHGLIYTPSDQVQTTINTLRIQLAQAADDVARDRLTAEIRREQAKLNKPSFILKEDSELLGAPLLVLDEASMVNAEMGEDLESFGTRILVLGDPMQLPPISGTGYFTDHPHDDLLTEIQRSEADSPVTKIATAVRQADPRDTWHGVRGELGDSGRRSSMRWTELLDYDQVIVGRKVTRWRVIRAIRTIRGFPPDVPVTGDRIMTLANSRETRVFNGQQFTVLECARMPAGRGGGKYQLQVADDEGMVRELPVWSAGFEGQDPEEHVTRQGAGRGPVAAATFAQAITCHKSQGSQFNSVLVVDEAGVFRDMAKRWLYTAVTRAAKQVVITSAAAFRR